MKYDVTVEAVISQTVRLVVRVDADSPEEAQSKAARLADACENPVGDYIDAQFTKLGFPNNPWDVEDSCAIPANDSVQPNVEVPE